jgi:hypothetical protein
MKKFLSVFISILIFASLFTISSSAAGTTIAFSSNTITIGDKVTVTITVDPGVAMYAVGYKLVYDSEKLSYPGSAGVITEVESPTGETKFIKQYTFTTLKVGTASIKVQECGYAGIDLVDKSFNDASAILTIKDVALPANANLSSLSLSAGALSPNFTSARTNYTASVPFETDKITLYAKTSDAKAKVNISSNPTNLNVGANTIKVTVTAQNGSQKIYTVVVTRREQGATSEPPVTSTPDTTPTNPFETVISGKNYEIVTTLPETATLQGFTSTTVEYNGAQVPVLRDKDNVYTVYYLREQGTTEAAPYLYNSELETFEVLKYQIFNNRLYIFSDFPSDVTMPSDYYWEYVTYGDGKFVAIGSTVDDGSWAAYSYDGINWEETVLPRNDTWTSLSYGKDRFLAVSYQSDDAIYSYDGITWYDKKLIADYHVVYQDGEDVTETAAQAIKPYLSVDVLTTEQLAELSALLEGV